MVFDDPPIACEQVSTVGADCKFGLGNRLSTFGRGRKQKSLVKNRNVTPPKSSLLSELFTDGISDQDVKHLQKLDCLTSRRMLLWPSDDDLAFGFG